MSVPLLSHLSPSTGTFSLFIASPEDLTRALEAYLKNDTHRILYLCGNYPVILPGLQRFSEKFVVRRALTAFQILTILDEAFQSVLIFEYDRSLFEERTDLLPIIGHRCSEYARKNAGVILIATCPDMYIRALEPFFNRVFLIRKIVQNDTRTILKRSKQLTLPGV